MTEILVHRRIGPYRAGDIVETDGVDAYWRAHIAAGNAQQLDDEPGEPAEPVEIADDDEDDDEAEEAAEAGSLGPPSWLGSYRAKREES